jgi:hypothetical protein
MLSKNPEAVGDTCSIYLSQEATSQASWRFIVRALFDEGAVTMGDFEAEPPGPGVIPSRLVAVANAPGAIGWAISANTPGSNERAAAWLASNRCSQGSAPGVTVIRNGPRNPTARRILTDGHGVNGGAPLKLLDIGNQLWRIEGDLQQVGVAAGTVVMLFDQKLMPVVGDAPIFSQLVGQEGIGTPSSPAHYEYEGDRRYGRPVTASLWLATSTGGGLFTPDPARSVDFHLVSSPP